MMNKRYFSRWCSGFFLFAILLLAACLKEGEEINTSDELQLVVVPSAREIGVGDSVHFDIILLGEIVEADLYINEQKVSQPQFKFTEEGTYEIQARKDGVKSSEILELVVGEGQPQLLVIPSETEVTAGEEVTFSVKMILNGTELPAGDAQIYINDSLISGYQYTFATVGTFQVVAKGFGGVRESDPVTLTVIENTNSGNVYIVGFVNEGAPSVAKLWKNTAANETILGDGVATDIVNFNGQFYISGHETYSNYTVKAKYWDNNFNEVILESGKSQANSIMVEPFDGGVMVGGSVDSNAVYWLWEKKNIVGSDAGYKIAINDAIWADGNVYAVGNKRENWQWNAVIWANGDRWGLSHDFSMANDIALKGGDYYVAGMVESRAVYWKNGTINYLTTPSGLSSTANDIALNNNDIYIAGTYQSRTEQDYAAVWIDGTMYKLTDDNGEGQANAIAVASDGTIYVAGWKSTTRFSETIATYWEIDPSGNILKTVELSDGTENEEALGITLGD